MHVKIISASHRDYRHVINCNHSWKRPRYLCGKVRWTALWSRTESL